MKLAKGTKVIEHARKHEATGTHAVTVFVPVHTVSEMNVHQHWRRRHARAKAQHAAVALKFAKLPLPALPVVVTFTRISGKTLDDDNLRSALKFIRDEVAAQYGVDDADQRITWRYGQADDARARGIVRIHIQPVLTEWAAKEAIVGLATSRLAASKRRWKGAK